MKWALWKSGKPRESEGALEMRVARLEGVLRDMAEAEAARALTVANTLTQLQRLAGRITKSAAIDEGARVGTVASIDDVYRVAREQNIIR